MLRLLYSKESLESLKVAFRVLLFGGACFGLGIIFTGYYVTFQQSTILSTQVKELTAQTERLVLYETHLRTYQHTVDERLSDFSSRFTRIEHLMHIPRYKRAAADGE